MCLWPSWFVAVIVEPRCDGCVDAGVSDGEEVCAPRPGRPQRAGRGREGGEAMRLRPRSTRRRWRPVLQTYQRPSAAQVDGARVDS